jgi:hypothetical protein
VNRNLFWDRRHNTRMSLWELADLLGVHPHTLDWRQLHDLAQQPIAVIIELAHQLDMHPSDLVPALDKVLSNSREPQASEPGPAAGVEAADVAADALTVLTALVIAVRPIGAVPLAIDLGWPHQRVLAALRHAEEHPQTAGPIALVRLGDGWTVRPRLDLLSPEQFKAVGRSRRPDLSVTDANALLAVMVLRPRTEYAGDGRTTFEDWRSRNLESLRRLREAALIENDTNHTKPGPHHDVLYSLRYDRRDPESWSASARRPHLSEMPAATGAAERPAAD